MKVSQPPIHGRHVVIVHNIDHGVLRRAMSTWRRLRRPYDPPCGLCALTRGVHGTNPRWQRFLDSLSEPVHVVTRDEWRTAHASSYWRNIQLPAILLQTGPKLEKLVSAKDIRSAATVKELSEKVEQALAAHPPPP